MNTASSSSCIQNLGVGVCGVIGILFCGVSVCLGASVSGMEVGPQGLLLILLFFSGCIGGAILIVFISLILSARGKSYSSFLVSVIISPAIALLVGVIVFPILSFVDAKSSERRQEIQEASKIKYDLLVPE